MRPVNLDGADPDHIKLMMDGVAWQLSNGDIDAFQYQGLMSDIISSIDYEYRHELCGCKSLFFHKDSKPPKLEEFCHHVSK